MFRSIPVSRIRTLRSRSATGAIFLLLLMIAGGLFFAPFAAADSASIDTAVFPGGGDFASSTTTTAMVTLGEPVIGVGGGDEYTAQVGFQRWLGGAAPTGTLTEELGGAYNQSVAVPAMLEDDTGVVSARLYYRKGGDAAFTEVQMTQVDFETGEWEGTIPASAATEKGIQYYVVASDGFLTGVLPLGAPASAIANIYVSVDDLNTFSLPAKKYVLLGMPMTPMPQDSDAEDIFNELGEYDQTVWRYGTYDGSEYDEYPYAEDPVPGQGFWIISSSARTIRTDGVSTALDQDFEIALHNGWNQFANPFGFAVDFDDVELPFGTEANVIGWNSDLGQYTSGESVLQARTGYWIKHEGTTGLKMTIPPVGSGTKLRTPGGGLLPDDGDGWSVRADASAGAFGDVGNRFGTRSDATAEKDPCDFSDPPPPPRGYVTLGFVSEESGQSLLADYRGAGTVGESWTLRLTSDQAGSNYEIRFTPDRQLPAGWQLLAINETTFAETDLLATGVISGQVTSSDFEATWRLIAGPADYLDGTREEITAPHLAGYAIRTVGPVPFRMQSGTTFALFVPEASQATVRIIGPDGKLVRTLHEGRLDRGIHQLGWDGTSNRGFAVASGVYFVQMQGAGFNEVRKVVLAR